MTESIKRRIAGFLVLFLFWLPLCPAETTPLGKDDFRVEIGDFSCLPGDPAGPLLKAIKETLGFNLEMTETGSCMFRGMDREYACESLLIGTHPNGPGGADTLESLLVFDDSLATFRGIRVGMQKNDVIAAYGEKGFEDWDELIFTDPETGAAVTFVFDLDTETVICWMLLKNTDEP